MNTGKKKKHTTLLPKMAVSNIRKNASTYFPYIGVSIFAMFTYFVFDLILKNDIMYSLPKGAYTLILVYIGFGLLSIIMVPFLYYTNSFLIKRRKKELGLYSILGLEKKHIGIMMFWESLAIYGVVMLLSIALGLVFSRLIFLLLLNLAKMPVNVEFSISPAAITDTLLFYAFVTGLNLLVNLIQVGKANPVELMSDSRSGEKEPKHILLWSIIGVLALVFGYRMAIFAKLDSKIFFDFFLAVFLVVIGTYFLFTSGSIACLRFLKRRKKFYYRPENFATISGMLYRMKKNAASLSNICIFSTMVIITAVCTVVVCADMDTIVRSAISRDFEINFFGNEKPDGESLRQQTAALAEQYQIELKDELAYSYVNVSCYKNEDENSFQMLEEGHFNFTQWYRMYLMTVQEYNLLEGAEEKLASGEVLLFTSGPDFAFDTVCFGDLEYTVKKELTESRLGRKAQNNTFDSFYMAVFADEEQLAEASAVFGVDGINHTSYFYGFKPAGEDTHIDSFSNALYQYVSGQPGFAQYQDHREQIAQQESMYGGLLFIGIFFGSIFLICLLIILYYKQITEGFEDQKNFEVMQKVGMDDNEIRRTIKKQVRMVFLLPLFGAILHTVVGMHMVYSLLGSIGFFEMTLLIICTAAGCLIFAILYSFSYKRTSMAYYRIVKQMD